MMTCIAIDDEPMALEVIERYCARSDQVKLRTVFLDPLKALEYLKKEPADLVFLDINMPGISGVKLAPTLPGKPLIIFTTAYSHYAVDSYNLDAVDYLLKPVTYDRFLKAIKKAIVAKSSNEIAMGEGEPIVYLKSGHQIYPVKRSEILYFEKAGNYISVHLKTKNILIRENMANVFILVPETDFIRIHKSFVVSISHIGKIENSQLTVNGLKLPIGSTYRAALLARLGISK